MALRWDDLRGVADWEDLCRRCEGDDILVADGGVVVLKNNVPREVGDFERPGVDVDVDVGQKTRRGP